MSASLYFATAENKQVRVQESLNFSNSNAASILAALGFTPNLQGDSIPLQEMENAVELYFNSEIAELIDGGMSPAQFGNITHCGRRKGYLTEKIDLIKNQLSSAKKAGAAICYFC